jgi:hypothetical protein
VTHIYIKPSSNQRSATSRVASAAGRLRPNAQTVEVKFIANADRHFSDFACRIRSADGENI